MALRVAGSSLRRRFAWTLVSAAAIAAVSLVWIVVYSATKKQVLGPPTNVAKADGAKAGTIESSGGTSADDQHQDLAATENRGEQPLGPKPAGDFHSPRYGYEVRLAGTAWVHWENLAEVVPEAEWGAVEGLRPLPGDPTGA